MKRKIKQFLAGCLSIAMTLSSPVASLAASTDFDGVSAGGHDDKGYVTGKGGDFSSNIEDGGNGLTSGKIGIRLSLVSPDDPSQVISVDDDGNPQVVDLLYVTEDTWKHQTLENYHSDLLDKFTYTSVKTQSLMNLEDNSEQTQMRVYYDQINAALTDGDMPPWLYHDGSRYISNGTTFSTWSKNNNYGVSGVGANGEFLTVDVSGYATKVKAYSFIDETGMKNLDLLTSTNWVSTNASEYANLGDATFDRINSELNGITVEKYQKKFNKYAGSGTEAAIEEIAEDLRDVVTQIKSWLAINQEETGSTSTTDYKSYADDVERRKTEVLAGLVDSSGKSIYSELNAAYNKAASDQASGNPDTTDTPNDAVTFGVSGNSGDDNSYSAHIAQLMKMQNPTTGSHYLQTSSMLTDSSLTLQTCSEDWILLVEPIVWLTIFPVGDDSRIIHSKLYGTITNLVQAFNDPSVPANPESLYKYRDRQTFNYKSITMPVWWALSVEDDGFAFVNSDNEATFGFYPATKVGSYRSFLELYNSYKDSEARTVTAWKKDEEGQSYSEQVTVPCTEGWGVNIYSKHMFEEVQPTTELDDDNENGGSIKVVKWYINEIYDSSGNVVSQTTAAVKTGTIGKKIAIINEPLLDGSVIYQVAGWMTGKDATAIPKDGDLNAKFTDYIKKSPGNAGGTEPAILDLSAYPDDKVLYIKLVYREVTPTGTITVIKVKDKTDGSTVIEKDSTNPGIYNATEEGWEYKEDTQTPDDEIPVSKWPDVPQGTSGNNPQIPVLDTTHTLYIHYTEKPQSPVEGGRARNGQSAFLVCPPFYRQCHV
jgi:hypothetical protein